LVGREVKGLQHLAFVDVALEQLLVLKLILVGHAKLPGHLRIPEKLLLYRCVVLMAALGDAHETFGRLNFHGQSLVGSQSVRLDNFLPIPVVLNTCNVQSETAWDLTHAVHVDWVTSFIINQILSVGIAVGPDALCGVDLEHFPVFALVYILRLRPVFRNLGSISRCSFHIYTFSLTLFLYSFSLYK